MNKTRYISKIDIGRILTEMLHEKNINNNESADNIFGLMKEIPVDDGRYLCNFSESNQKILNKYMYVLDAPLDWERFLYDMGLFPFDVKDIIQINVGLSLPQSIILASFQQTKTPQMPCLMRYMNM